MISRLRALWNNVFRRKQLDRDLDEELQAYVELLSAEKVQTGVDPEDAHRWTSSHRSPVAGRKPASLSRWCRCGTDASIESRGVMHAIHLTAK